MILTLTIISGMITSLLYILSETVRGKVEPIPNIVWIVSDLLYNLFLGWTILLVAALVGWFLNG